MAVLVGASITFATLTTQALAGGVIPIDGVFGNAEGCGVYQTGVPVANYLVLTGDTFSSMQVGCAFLSLASVDKGVYIGDAICSPGGAQTVRVIDHGMAGYGFVVGEGVEVGPLAACLPVGNTASLSRVKL